MLIDTFGRVARDLRVSLTDRCGLRCTYCMPAEGLPWLPSEQLLSDAELLRLVSLLVAQGIGEVRLTGGEPLLRPGIVDLVRELSGLAVPLSLTTNGVSLPKLARPLRDAGLQRVNISLDTLQRSRFIDLTRRDRLADVLAGVTAAVQAGLAPVKINTVLVRGVNDDEAVDLLAWALQEQVSLRFIERMPLDPQHSWSPGEVISGAEVRAQLSQRWSLTPVGHDGPDPATLWWVDGGPATVGTVDSVSAPFCSACDRLRLTSDGALRTCLFARGETDLRGPLRAGATDSELAEIISNAVLGKTWAHGIGEPGFTQPDRPMSAIGG
jgi:cyclic pyranopterin phosphate synthase